MDAQIFWQIIEEAWIPAGPKINWIRDQLTAGHQTLDLLEQMQEVIEEKIIPTLTTRLNTLDAQSLKAFDRILEQKLYELDQREISEYGGGGDDGFLYARSFIVILGQAYYEAVLSDPTKTPRDEEWWAEELPYLAARLYKAKFGELVRSGISRETGSNKAGWEGK